MAAACKSKSLVRGHLSVVYHHQTTVLREANSDVILRLYREEFFILGFTFMDLYTTLDKRWCRSGSGRECLLQQEELLSLGAEDKGGGGGN